MSGYLQVDHEVETELVRKASGPVRVYVRLYEVKTITSRNATEDVTPTRILLDAWTCRVGEGDFQGSEDA